MFLGVQFFMSVILDRARETLTDIRITMEERDFVLKHPTFCGHDFLDLQNRVSYTSTHIKKEVRNRHHVPTCSAVFSSCFSPFVCRMQR